MDLSKSKKFLLTIALIYWALVGLIFAVAHEAFSITIPNTFINIYWLSVSLLFILIASYCVWGYIRGKHNKNNMVVALCTLATKYNFLLKQLVNRDFKVKYKRSVLGVLWSFINPLLTMGVQYIVFSALFSTDIPNYAVYLLIGIVFFNFFNEAVGQGMTSITGNANLIKKVYMPKYIYPLAKLLSSSINFIITLIPLAIVMAITKTVPTWSMLLIIFDLLCFLGFIFGMILILSTLMTFFQDTQFLWTVVSMIWMYLTPIFYNETIIPESYRVLFHLNPMYQYISFARICLIGGSSPAPMQYVYCIASSVVVLILGLFIFKKNQDKFVLHL